MKCVKNGNPEFKLENPLEVELHSPQWIKIDNDIDRFKEWLNYFIKYKVFAYIPKKKKTTVRPGFLSPSTYLWAIYYHGWFYVRMIEANIVEFHEKLT